MSKKASAGGAAINLLQITDCHLTKDPSGDLLGVVTQESLAAVLAQIDNDISTKRCPEPDLVLATGDIAQDASEEAYTHFRQALKRYPCPSRWFPGNHDDGQKMDVLLSDGEELEKVWVSDNWVIVTLDSSVRGAVHGHLAPSELEILEKQLHAHQGKHILVSFHHHPVDIGSAWLDKIGLHNRDELFDVLDQYDNVKGVLWGHIHQDFESKRKGVKLMASPSTCIQFTPKSQGFGVEPVAPGYRWLTLKANGEIETQVIRAENYQFNLDMESSGY